MATLWFEGFYSIVLPIFQCSCLLGFRFAYHQIRSTPSPVLLLISALLCLRILWHKLLWTEPGLAIDCNDHDSFVCTRWSPYTHHDYVRASLLRCVSISSRIYALLPIMGSVMHPMPARASVWLNKVSSTNTLCYVANAQCCMSPVIHGLQLYTPSRFAFCYQLHTVQSRMWSNSTSHYTIDDSRFI